MRFHRSKFMALCATLPSCVFAVSQTVPTGTITGQVTDPGNAAIVGAQIEVRQSSSSITYRAVADAQGHFAFANLPAGHYDVRAARDAFRDQRQSVEVKAGGSLSLSYSLPVSSLTQTVTVEAKSSIITETPTGQTQAQVSREDFKNTPATNIAEVLSLVPGVTFVQGNGPRDVSISVRGSNERQTYGVRNIQVFEDGFAVTQSDGLARTDLTDPHAYSSIDVVEGPSSALYGNYATGGAINFHTRSGSEIQGLEVGADFGSFGYFNDFATYGVGNERYQLSAFLSNVRAD